MLLVRFWPAIFILFYLYLVYLGQGNKNKDFEVKISVLLSIILEKTIRRDLNISPLKAIEEPPSQRFSFLSSAGRKER